MTTSNTKKRSLSKDILFPGMVLQVRTDVPLSNGLESAAALMFGQGTNNGLAHQIAFVTASSRGRAGLANFHLHPGDVCTLVHGPKRVVGANVVRVKAADGQEGYVFWCEFKACCLPYGDPNAASSPTTSPTTSPRR